MKIFYNLHCAKVDIRIQRFVPIPKDRLGSRTVVGESRQHVSDSPVSSRQTAPPLAGRTASAPPASPVCRASSAYACEVSALRALIAATAKVIGENSHKYEFSEAALLVKTISLVYQKTAPAKRRSFWRKRVDPPQRTAFDLRGLSRFCCAKR